MSPSRIQFVSQGRRLPFFKGPDLSSADHPWAGYLFEESNGHSERLAHICFPKTTLLLCTGGKGTTRRKYRGVWEINSIRPGSVCIIRRDVELDVWTSDAWPAMALQLDNSKLHHIAPDEVNTIEKSLVSVLTTRDRQLVSLMLAMRQEVREGCRSGRLFGESLSLALLAYLAGTYATPCMEDDRGIHLSPSQKRGLAEYIRTNLDGDISVKELAGLVNLSPAHFSRRFKASFGVTPYRFVMQERVDGAKTMLASTGMSSSQVAMAFGFASQSHFVKVFRQFTGVTPKRYKAGF